MFAKPKLTQSEYNTVNILEFDINQQLYPPKMKELFLPHAVHHPYVLKQTLQINVFSQHKFT